MAMPSGRRARLLPLALVCTAALGAGIASGAANGAAVNYCDAVYTPAHGWCYNGAPFAWRYVQSTYSGSGSFGICAAVNNYYTRVTRFKDCRNIVTSNGYAGGCTNTSDTQLDPGTGNQDDNRHTIHGYANNYSC